LIGAIFAAVNVPLTAHAVSASTFLGVQTLGMPEWLIEVDGFAVLQ